MILTVHVDNSNITLAVQEQEQARIFMSIASDRHATADQFAASMAWVCHLNQVQPDQAQGAILSSVVPMLTPVVLAALHKLLTCEVLVVGPGMKTGLNIRLDHVSTVGADFICNAVGALKEFTPPLVVISMTGATTFMALDEQGCLIGRSILPGVESSLEHLCDTSAQLPSVCFEEDCRLMGKSTAEGIKSGVLYGAVSMVEGMLQRYAQELGGKVTAVATGEIAQPILKLCRAEILYRPSLLHDGLRHLWNKNR